MTENIIKILTGCYVIGETIKINHWHPYVCCIFLMDLILGPLVVLFCQDYTWKEYFYELKAIINGEYNWKEQ